MLNEIGVDKKVLRISLESCPQFVTFFTLSFLQTLSLNQELRAQKILEK
jgi:hypothetical protein